MTKQLPLLLLFFVAVAGTMYEPAPPAVTIEGTIIDSKCYGMNHMNTGDEHVSTSADGSTLKIPSCGTACATMGIPVGILEGGKADGNVHLIIGPASGFANYMAKEVKVEGTQPYPGAIIPSKMWVKNAKGAWEEATLPATMM